MCQLRKSRIKIKVNVIMCVNVDEVIKLLEKNQCNAIIDIIKNTNDKNNDDCINY